MNTPRLIREQYDIVVVGGGLSGMFAAIAAARRGKRVALIQARSMYGGNASSEIRMHIVGANCHNAKPNLSETGLLMELLLTNKRRNPYAVFPVWDALMWEMVRQEPNITGYLNTVFDAVHTDGDRIVSIEAFQQTTETRYHFRAEIFVDATGNGSLGAAAGAEWRIGSEGRDEFSEPSASEAANDDTMGNTLMFQAVDRGEPVEFIKPEWAYSFTEEDLRHRPHVNLTNAMGDEGAPVDFVKGNQTALPHFSVMDAGYWWIELGGQYDDIIAQSEEIRDELMRCVYGVWDHIKNAGDHGAANYDLEWVGIVPGYRESRRLVGDVLLNENDVRANRVFDDAVAYGAWPMDIHARGGILDFDVYPSRILNFEGAYSIPYRAYYSKNVSNLMMAGRDISCTKLAMGSTRVMGTCAIGGQAVGTAAALAVEYGITPREVGRRHIRALQQQLLKDDCYIPGFVNEDENDWARTAAVTASAHAPDGTPEQVINGVARAVGDATNAWICPMNGGEPWLSLALSTPKPIAEIRLTFDPNLSREIMPSITSTVRARQPKGMPEELVRDYTVELLLHGESVHRRAVTGNYQRQNILPLDPPIKADQLRLTIQNTHGAKEARVFEVRMY